MIKLWEMVVLVLFTGVIHAENPVPAGVFIAEGNRPGYYCPRTAKPIIIGGPAEQWKDIPAIVLDDDNKYYFMMTTLPRKGNADLSALAKMCYDDRNFYFRADVTDDVFTQKGLALDAWNGDSLQFAISNDGKSNYWEFILALCQDKPVFLCHHAGAGTDANAITNKVQYNVKRIDKTHMVYEFAIPWSQLSPLNSATERFRFSFLINEADDGPRKAYFQWSSGIGQSKNPNEYGDVVLLKEKLASDAPLKGQISVDRKIITDNDEYTVNLSLSTGKPVEGKIIFEVESKAGSVARQMKDTPITNKTVTHAFTWKTATEPGGMYEVNFSVTNKNGKELGKISERIEKLNQKEIEKTVAEFQKDGTELHALLKRCEEKKIPTPYQKAALTLVEHFAPWVSNDLNLKERPYNPLMDAAPLPEPQKIVGPIKSLFWNRARDNAEYVRGQVKHAITQAKELLEKPELAVGVPVLDRDTFTCKDGVFRDKNGPIILMGAQFGEYAKTPDELKIIADYGFNWWGINLGGYPPKSGFTKPIAEWDSIEPLDNWPTGFMPYTFKQEYERAEQLSMVLSSWFPWWCNVPDIAEKHDPGCGSGFMVDIEDPQKAQRFGEYIRYLAGHAAKYKSHMGFALHNEVSYGFCSCSRGLRDFKKAMREKYGTIEKLNSQWATNYQSFEELMVPKSRDGNKGHWYDYNVMHLTKLPKRIKWMADQCKAVDPRKSWCYTKLLHTLGFHDYCGDGIDREAMGDVVDLWEFDAYIWYGRSGQFAFSPWGEIGPDDLFRSLDPSKGMMETEFHMIPHDSWERINQDHIKACFWITSVHGVDGFNIWIWERPGYNGSNGNPIDEHADRTHAFSTAALDLRRLAKYVTAIPAQKSEVAILFNNACQILVDNQWNKLMDVYRGFYWLNTPPTDFVTDRQIAAGKLDQYKLLVVHTTPYILPETMAKINGFVKNGGTVVLTLDSAKWDPYGKPLALAGLLAGPREKTPEGYLTRYGKGRVYYVGGDMNMEQWTRYFNKVYAEIGVKRGKLFLTDGSGRPMVGVENREAEVDGKRIVYLMNITCSPVEIPLKAVSSGEIEELITRKILPGNTLTLKPLVPNLLQVK